MNIYLLIILSLVFFILFITPIFLGLLYVNRLKHKFSDVLTENTFKNDETEKTALVLKTEKENLEKALSAQKRDYEERIEAIKRDYEKRLSDQREEFSGLESKLKDAFENLSSRILENKGKEFTDLNSRNIDAILKPLSETIKDFGKKVDDRYNSSSNEIFSLKDQINKFMTSEKTMIQTTENLIRALKGDSKLQGSWGEMVLARILDNSGLNEGEEYELQKTVKSVDEDGYFKMLRPDAIIRLPENRKIVIDSKVSLSDYEKYINGNEEGEAIREGYLSAHKESLKRHISELSGKYQNLPGTPSPDFVIMFVPIDYALAVAAKDSDIIYNAFKNNIILATPSVLMLIIKTVENLWKQENLDKNAKKILVEATGLYDKFIGFIEDMKNIDKGISATRKSYDDAFKKLNSGKGNIIKRLETIKAAGVTTTKSLPESVEYDNN